jgi:hypothetical protein
MRKILLPLALALFVTCAFGADDGVSMNDIKPVMKALDVTLKVTERPAWPKVPSLSVDVALVPQVPQEHLVTQIVSFGLPFGPGWLTDHKKIRVLAPNGKEIPAFTKPLVHWWIDGKKGTLRSVLVQFDMASVAPAPKKVVISFEQPRKLSRPAEIPVAETLVSRHVDPPKGYESRAFSYDYQCPRVLAVLPADWMCDSLVAWQQVPLAESDNAAWFDKHLLDKVDYSFRNSSAKGYEAYLFDRAATYAKIYVRHADAKFLLGAIQANEFYMQKLSPAGFFTLKKGNDFKYSFNEGSALLYMLTGDPRYLDVVNRIAKVWDKRTFGKNGKFAVGYTKDSNFWTERHHGFGMAAYVHAYEITGERKHLDVSRAYLDAALSMQVAPADGKAPDGAWVHRSGAHGDGNGWTTSPWMSAFLMDSIWKYWMLSDDIRAAASLALYSKFTSRQSITPDGKRVYYMANSSGRGSSINPGVEHNFEGMYMLAMGYYLSGGTDDSFLGQIETLWPPVMNDGANNPGRKFNWRFRETSMLIWFLQNAK